MKMRFKEVGLIIKLVSEKKDRVGKCAIQIKTNIEQCTIKLKYIEL